MPSFRDNKNRMWNVDVEVDALKRVRSLTGFDLLTMAQDAAAVQRIAADPVLLCDVLYALLKPQAETAKINDEAFGQGLAGDAIEDAAKALMEGLIGFFPRERRELLQKAADKHREMQARLSTRKRELILKRLDEAVAEAERKELATLSPTLGKPSTASPESPASTPAP